MVIPSTSHKDEVMKLIERKEQIERSINDCGHILAANKNVGMNESLLDAEGFPRADIDVYAVRQARHQIICLQNDLKAIMKDIEKGLINVHAEARTNANTTTTTTKMYASIAFSHSSHTSICAFIYINCSISFLCIRKTKRADMDITPESESPIERARSMETIHETPILNVTLVMPGSPADECGIRIDDQILEFGSINPSNFKELKQISDLVTHRQNQPIALKVKRHGRIHDVTLVPKVWSGRGLLGCNIVIPNPSQ